MKISMNLHARHYSEITWVIAGQAVTALGTLIGTRLLTQFVAPSVYGVVSLALGLSALATNLACVPLAQAAMHHYPAEAASGTLGDLRDAIYRCMRRSALWVVLPLLVVASAYALASQRSSFLGFILIALFLCDCFKSVGLSVLNSARRQRRYTIWAASDAWARPLMALAAIVGLGQSANTILAAYLIASFALIIVFQSNLWGTGLSAASGKMVHSLSAGVALDRQIWRYAGSLIPLGLIAWVINLGDRYVIGGLLGLGSAGVYAAIYGLSSAPLMIIGGTIEQAMRPIHQHAVSHGDHRRANTLFTLWLVAVTVTCAICIAGLDRWRELISTLFLGPQYRAQADLMPWIAAGYGIRCIAYVFERICYAYGRTQRVLIIQCCAALATVIATPIGVFGWGLKGAAVAVPVYFGVELIVAASLATKFLRGTSNLPAT
jgi:O-antigen/teichoic acid export membrane protein